MQAWREVVVISAVKPDELASNFQQRDNAHRRDDAGNRLAAAQRARVFGGHGEEEAWFLADHFESGKRRPPLPHRDASRSLTWPRTWPSRRLISRSRWRGFPPRRSSNCAASGGGCIGRRRRCGCPHLTSLVRLS